VKGTKLIIYTKFYYAFIIFYLKLIILQTILRAGHMKFVAVTI